MDHVIFFVFKDSAGIKGELRLDVSGNFFEIFLDDRHVAVNTEVLAPGRTAMVLYSPLKDTVFVHYGYSEMCEMLDVTQSEFLTRTMAKALMQLVRCNDGTLVAKIFMPDGQDKVASNAAEIRDCPVMDKSCISPVDWQYEPSVDVTRIWHDGEHLYVELAYCPGVVPITEYLLNYAGQVLPLHTGDGTYVFTLVPGENIYVGPAYRRNKGMMLNVEEYLRCSSLE